ncbi:SH3 domain-containing protein [Celeribacter litoreus]|uniref:SH3 domain-containing protein n=1 Tax=Celeribacter litoreus TaxID=2876714 RepID=UPI001CC909CB|nr:SH3 domain-containing protein [Celeribacter litoreus]MCA0042389.1 SH3 domain-containing protein [Celeribacter litoreus]
MLRLTVMTLAGLWAGLMTFGTDLTAEEQAALDARRAEQTPLQTQIIAVLSDSFATEQKRQGAYVPTLAEIAAKEAVTPTKRDALQSPLVHLASAKVTPPQVSTTRVSHPEKLAAALSGKPLNVTNVAMPAPIQKVTPTTAEKDTADLREVTASRVNVRSGPSTNFEVMGQVSRADIVQIVSPVENGWVKILVEGDGVEGFMAARFLTSPDE